MTKKEWQIIITINILAFLGIIIPFIKGSNFLAPLWFVIFSFLQIAGMFGLIATPIGLIWTAFELIKKRKLTLFPVVLWTTLPILFIFGVLQMNNLLNHSRNIAMNNAEKLIEGINNYKNENNQYPKNLEELKPKYIEEIPNTGVMGAFGYDYFKKEDSYQLEFTQNVIFGFNTETTMYESTNNHKVIVGRGKYYETGKEKWKYYFYD